MMSENSITIADVKLRKDRPTELAFEALYSWVIWQFPKKKSGGLCGAVKPPLANHSWYPALIRKMDKKIFVCGHLEIEFSTPDEAASWLEKEGGPALFS